MASRDLVTRDARSLALDAGPIDYVVVRRAGRRGVGLKVDETGPTVRRPANITLAGIEAFAREAERWILRKIAEWSARQVPAVAWNDGAPLHFLGESVRLRVAAGKRSHAELVAGELRVTARAGGEDGIRPAVVRWHPRAAHRWLAGRTPGPASRPGTAPPEDTIFLAPARS